MSVKKGLSTALLLMMFILAALPAFAGEADIILPDLSTVTFTIFGSVVSGVSIMYFGIIICFIGLIFAVMQANQTKKMPAHKAMLEVSAVIWETCKSYLRPAGQVSSSFSGS